jgi:rubredoxin
MLVTDVFYGVKCDRCGDLYEDSDGHTFFSSADSPIEGASDDEWKEVKSKHYCPNCYTKDDDDNVVPKPDYPKSVEIVKEFIKLIKKSTPRITEFTDAFEIRAYENYGELMPYDIQWLKDRLGDSLVSIERVDIKNHRNKEIVILLKQE